MKSTLSQEERIIENVLMPIKKQTGKCDCPKNARKAYKEIVKTRRQLTKSLLPLVRKALQLLVEIDRATHIIAAELRKQQLDENGS